MIIHDIPSIVHAKSIAIRSLETWDLNELRSLHHLEHAIYGRNRDHFDHFAEWAARLFSLGLVVTADRAIVGYVLATRKPFQPTGSGGRGRPPIGNRPRIIELLDIAIARPYRRQKLALTLLDRLVLMATPGRYHFRADVDEYATPAHLLLRKHGWTAQSIRQHPQHPHALYRFTRPCVVPTPSPTGPLTA
jgi:GNAT superfamily N-acetyltransferase